MVHDSWFRVSTGHKQVWLDLLSGLGFRIQGTGFRVHGAWFKVSGSWLRVSTGRTKVQSSRSWVESSQSIPRVRHRQVQSSETGVESSQVIPRVQVSGLGVPAKNLKTLQLVTSSPRNQCSKLEAGRSPRQSLRRGRQKSFFPQR